jgi:4-amino-4-deoxy-L-arabinose transferase-like glycosyltransferase
MEPIGRRRRTSGLILVSVLALLTAGFVLYSQTMAFTWDEGFHILTAQLIKHGERPYIDFVFSQTPLNAYWNAGWMAVFGESWRVSHLMAALCSAAAVILTVRFVFLRFPVAEWRLPAAMLATALAGLNVLVVRYGGIAQAYGFALLAVVAAFLLAVRSVQRQSVSSAGLAGLASGIAAGASLLTTPVSPVLLIWMLIHTQARLRWAKFAAFALGTATALLPVLWLFAQGPRQVLFGVIEYNALYRRVDWQTAPQHNFELLLSWIDSGPTLLLLLLGAGGLLYIRFRSTWEAPRKAELYLCAWLSVTLAVYISSAVLPAFPQYYIFAVPFLSILAVAGGYAAIASLDAADRPWKPILALAFLLAFGLGKALYDERDTYVWTDLEKIAKKVDEVTTPQQTLFADESIYFLTRHAPPSGMEMWNSHKFNFAQPEMDLLHLISQAELNRQVQGGRFGTLETCEDPEDVEAHGYAKLYAKSAKLRDCMIFWEKKPAAP